MRKLFEICQKYNFLPFWFFLSFEGGEFSQKRCKIVCSDVSGTTWKIPFLNPEKMTIFPHLALFSICPSQKFWDSHPLKNYVSEKYKNRTIITQSVILTPSYLWFLGAFENYLFFIIVLTIISRKQHVIKQLP